MGCAKTFTTTLPKGWGPPNEMVVRAKFNARLFIIGVPTIHTIFLYIREK